MCHDAGVFAGDIVNVTAIEDVDRVTVRAENTSFAPLTIKLVTSGENITSSCFDACVSSIGSNAVKIIDEIQPRDRNKDWRYETNYNYAIGAIVERYDLDYVYSPPFAHGDKYYLSQAFNGRFSHGNTNAIDFTMPEGTAIHAARAGRVIDVVEHFKQGGLDPDLKDKVNYIAVQHSDGTVGKYAHLKFNGVMAKPGDNISKGQLIAYSGATGFGMGPHLHFEVTLITQTGDLQTIPFLIRSRRGLAQLPKLGYYYAVHEGKPYFIEVYADEIDFSRYFNRQTAVNVTGVKNRQVNLDDHVFVYVQNGKKNAIEVQTFMTLEGFKSIRPVPEKILIRPGTERLIAVIYQYDKSRQARYSFNYKYWERH